MSEIIIQPAVTNIPDQDIKDYCKKHKVAPMEAFSDLLSERLFNKIDVGEYATVLRVLVENVIGKGAKK